MVARDAERVAVGHHAHREPQHARDVGAAVDEVAEEDEAASLGVLGADAAAVLVAPEDIAQLHQKRFEFGPAAVDVADDVEGASSGRAGRCRAWYG